MTTTITGLKIINIFSYQDSSPTELKKKYLKLKREFGSSKQAMDALNKDNKLEDGVWRNLVSGAELVVAAWGNCASIADIDRKKEEVSSRFHVYPFQLNL